MAEHRDDLRRIEAVGACVFVYLDEQACPGRGTLVIAYPGHPTRKELDRLLDKDDFFGIPYSLKNV